MKAKNPTVASLKKEVWSLFSKYIRIRDCLFTTGSREYGRCITCGEQFPFVQLQAGHFIAGRHNANLFSERGTHAQCKRCNIIEHGRPLEYRRQIIKLYGDGADLELEAEARQVKKFTIQELEEMKADLQKKISDLSQK